MITAKDARQISLQENGEKISEKISEEAKKGNFSLIIPYIPPEILEKMKSLGFEVEENKNKEDPTDTWVYGFRISW